MTIKIIIQGADEVKKYLKDREKNIKQETSTGLSKAALFVQGEVKSSIAGQRAEPTSVDTGRFLNSVDINVGKDDAIIFTDISYSKFLEYGTSNIIPRSHFRNSAARNKQKAKELIESEIKKSI